MKDSNEPITFSPSKVDVYIGVGLCIFLAIIILLRYIEELNSLSSLLLGLFILSWMLTYYLVRLNNQLTISSSSVSYEGRASLLFLHKKIELKWKDISYCRTRSYKRGYIESIQFLDFYDLYDRKLYTVRIDYFEKNDIETIVQFLTSKRKFDQQKSIKHSQWFILMFIIPLASLLLFAMVYLAKLFS